MTTLATTTLITTTTKSTTRGITGTLVIKELSFLFNLYWSNFYALNSND